ncbi:MAG: hypothetical protein L0271_11105 [Gemmatimonadetes bacterium]|nr:hypothetical protein [Gemmatimonadota bacterium]
MSASSIRLLPGLAAMLMIGGTPLAAQLIGVKSVPVAAGDQFLIHPTRNLGMGSVSIALEDPLLDPFTNPAKGVRLPDARLYGSPTFYSVSNGDGSARTLPVGGLFGSQTWFGGASISLQQIEGADRNRGVIFLEDFARSGQPLSEQSANNMYAFGMIGRNLNAGKLAIGASILYADLEAMDGVDLLYALSQSIDQSGHVADVRLGLAGESPTGARYEAMLLHHRTDMRHDVTYFDWTCCVGDTSPVPFPRTRTEENLDQTNTWGVHLGYDRPVGQHGWRIGGILTGNVMSHPKIPNYEIMNIPRDPGDSWAYNFGVGVSRTLGPTLFGLDIIYEPIWSDTWAEADSTITLPGGGTLQKGSKTIENDFRFSNAILRTGVARETDRWGLNLGVQVRSYSYTLEQHDNLQRTRREQDESWMEWTPSWGAALKFPDLTLRYTGRTTTGTGRPGVAWGAEVRAAADALSSFIVAPSGPLTLQEARVTTHQVSVSLPIR